METYSVKRYRPNGNPVKVSVPASKSILNRALVLSALAKGTVFLRCGSYGEDTRALLGCLSALGIPVKRSESGLTVCGCGGNLPCKRAEIYVGSAGTAARFLAPVLAVCGGDYTFRSSEQMERRPMEILRLLENSGVTIEYLKQRGRFPFRLVSEGLQAEKIDVDTDESTQYASGLLLAATAREKPLVLRLTGKRTNGSYIAMTLALLNAFHAQVTVRENEITVTAPESSPTEFVVEPDLSGACYFYALSLLFGEKVLVYGVKKQSLQGDGAFLNLLGSRGVRLEETDEGLLADGSDVTSFRGFCEDMSDFSDQTLTVAALAPFAATPSLLKNVGHIRKQECDRIAAICSNLSALGVSAQSDGENIRIDPAPIRGGLVRTFSDHRVAMAFSLIGLKTGNVLIENPDCCKKTFENYFGILDELTKH